MEAEIVDSLLISRFDSVYTYPEEMETEFRQAQKGLTDSSAYYKLELFTGYCLYLRGYQDSAVHLNQKVLDFCKQHPGLMPSKLPVGITVMHYSKGSTKKILPLRVSTTLTMPYTGPMTTKN